jgi:GTPase SAR1 family protein
MGGCVSDEDQAGYRRNKAVELYIRKQNKQYDREAKILLLGSGDSGKSTFLRQIKHLHKVDEGLDSEKMKFTSVIKHNCLKSFKDFLNMVQAREMEIPAKLKDRVEQVINSDAELDEEIGLAIEKLWASKKVKKCYEKLEVHLQIPTNSPYFWKIAKTVSQDDYEPTKDDIIQAKIRTIGIQETHFVYEGVKFLMVDVGGQRSERRKWLHCFNNITAVIFLTAVDEYDGKVLEEDNHTNRLFDSLSLFEKLSESSWFENVPFILFLNKIDLFDAKIKHIPLDTIFDDFDAVIKELGKEKENKRTQSVNYLYNKFHSRYRGKGQLYHFETNATDEEICGKVFNSIREDIILKKITGFII